MRLFAATQLLVHVVQFLSIAYYQEREATSTMHPVYAIACRIHLRRVQQTFLSSRIANIVCGFYRAYP